MTKELDEALCKDFPELFRVCRGFSCDDGWEPIIRELCEKLQKLARIERHQPVVTQVKEKFGTLRFYVDSATDIQYDVIAAAERKSSQTCEICGEYGELTGKSWVKTLCEEHVKILA